MRLSNNEIEIDYSNSYDILGIMESLSYSDPCPIDFVNEVFKKYMEVKKEVEHEIVNFVDVESYVYLSIEDLIMERLNDVYSCDEDYINSEEYQGDILEAYMEMLSYNDSFGVLSFYIKVALDFLHLAYVSDDEAYNPVINGAQTHIGPYED